MFLYVCMYVWVYVCKCEDGDVSCEFFERERGLVLGSLKSGKMGGSGDG